MTVTRRNLLTGGLAAVGGGLLNSCAGNGGPTETGALPLPAQSPLTPASGRSVITRTLTARPVTLDLGGPTVDTWAYADTAPGPLIRASAGDLLRITLENQLPADTSIHWHGIALRNASDGVPTLTQSPVASGATFTYEFVAPDPGTYFYHPHVGLQLDRGLYAPLIIDDPNEPGAYDTEWIVILDDWLDGTGTTPDEVMAGLTGGSCSGHGDMGGMEGMDMGDDTATPGMDSSGDMSGLMSGTGSPFGDAGDVTYPHFLINGRVATSPDVLRAKPGQRVRIRIINAAADTIFAVALGGHRLNVTHTDGFPVRAQNTSALYVGMGERYDVTVTLKEGAFPLVAKPLGKDGVALAAIRTGTGALPAPATAGTIDELRGPILNGAELLPADSARLPSASIGQQLELVLSGQMAPYAWAINGAPYGKNKPVLLEEGKRVRMQLSNMTMMSHPMHLHGHTFALPNGLRKDTVLLKPMEKLNVDLQADNPGNWMAHCHNAYHAEAGMMTALTYRA